jgi:HTH-type transcriptional regulator/antitoxin HipB
MNVEIAERLAQRRREAGYSQEALAERLGVTRQAVSKWERSESSPDTDNLIALARLYQVSLDELLNVSPAIAEDVEFEATDRAMNKNEQGSQDRTDSEQTVEPGNRQTDGSNNAASDGVSNADDDSYVHITPWDGVHVKDARTGDEVHVGWRGIHVVESGGNKEVRVDRQGIDVREGDEKVWSGKWSDWREWEYDFGVRRKDDEQTRRMRKIWYSFPIYLLAIIAYLLAGFFAPVIVRGAGSFTGWQYGIFVFALVPLYYMVANAILRRRLIRFVQGLWPYACLVAYLWMWLMEGLPHPTWVVFLSIPMVEWICEAVRRSRRWPDSDGDQEPIDLSVSLSALDDDQATDADEDDQGLIELSISLSSDEDGDDRG